MMTKNCTVCGREMQVKPARLERTKFCSKACAKEGWKGVRRAPGTEFKKGQKPLNYKGGRMISDGYILLLMRDHPRANPNGYVAEHLIVCEQKLGHPIPRGWVVHHLNGNRADNRPENLEAMPRAYHHQGLHIEGYKRRIVELEAQIERLQASLQQQS
jgi:hypothetical protein